VVCTFKIIKRERREKKKGGSREIELFILFHSSSTKNKNKISKL